MIVTLASLADKPENKYAHTMSKIAHAKAYCEVHTAAVDKQAMDADTQYAHLFHSSPSVLQLELKQDVQTHNDRLRECIYLQEVGREQWRLQ